MSDELPEEMVEAAAMLQAIECRIPLSDSVRSEVHRILRAAGVPALLAERDRLRAALAAVEWGSFRTIQGHLHVACPQCGGLRYGPKGQNEHLPACQLAAALALAAPLKCNTCCEPLDSDGFCPRERFHPPKD